MSCKNIRDERESQTTDILSKLDQWFPIRLLQLVCKCVVVVWEKISRSTEGCVPPTGTAECTVNCQKTDDAPWQFYSLSCTERWKRLKSTIRPSDLSITHHEICGWPWIRMSEVDGINTESLLQLVFVLDPMKMEEANYQPLGDIPQIWNVMRTSTRVNLPFLSHSPECSAIKVNHHPFGRVECERICMFNSIQKWSEFWTQKCCPSICSIDVKPETLFNT